MHGEDNKKKLLVQYCTLSSRTDNRKYTDEELCSVLEAGSTRIEYCLISLNINFMLILKVCISRL